MYSKYILNPIFLIISNNIPKYFLFHDNYYEVNFLYYHTEIGNDLLVDFKMNHSSIYEYYNRYFSFNKQIRAS